MTETTRTMECSAPAATLFVAFELGSTTWVMAMTTAMASQRPRVRQIPAGDLSGLMRELLTAKARFGLALDAPVRRCYEAGRDGFWLPRWLEAQGIATVVVDSSSIDVSRRSRQAKTDRLDALGLLALRQRWARGETRALRVVHVPTPEAEAARQLTREITTVRIDRRAVRTRIQGLLVAQGIRCTVTRHFVERLAELQTGDGRPLAAAWRDRLTRAWAHVQTLERRLATLQTIRDAAIATAGDRVAQVAQRLCPLRGVAETSAAIYSAELFGTRTFANGRQIGALIGLVPVPYRSDQRVQDQGISKAGRTELRRVRIQLAWAWLRWQPDSALAVWFQRRFAAAGGRSRRIGLVAVARKLVIALWRFVEYGVVPGGAHLKATT